MDFKENTFSVKIIDPSDTEIISKRIDTDDCRTRIQSIKFWKL